MLKCFKIFLARLEELAKSAQASEVEFYIYCGLKQLGTILVTNDTDRLKPTCFDPHYKTVLITHGFQSSKTSDVCVLIRDGII